MSNLSSKELNAIAEARKSGHKKWDLWIEFMEQHKKLSREELIAIANKLLNGDFATDAEGRHLFETFEENLPYHYAGDLIDDYSHEFKNATELVDFALGIEDEPKLSREDLIAITKRIMTPETTSKIEHERLCNQFSANVPHPDGICLIYHPKIEFQTPEELVDYALSYKDTKKST
ncbi:MAG TPA: hypothetical protein VHN11_06740 [Xanthobacteraceae bacterium]|jgi:hypothetical protein|nr:hypothetical protein [Xanthobacteraceae bacterium]